MRPLAERIRPRTLDEMVGQRRLLAPGTALRRAVESGHVHSMILWGPPGCGKTTLALLLASYAAYVAGASLAAARQAGDWGTLVRLPLVIAAYHLGYGVGTWRGLFDLLLRRNAGQQWSRLTR